MKQEREIQQASKEKLEHEEERKKLIKDLAQRQKKEYLVHYRN